ncbi:VOC family protein [Sphingobium mellinum]|uniref:VOC family protein n=1 Tax=Sphingobium mellinum TaxID=1387166 RepID=UPI0030ECC2B2
MFTHVMVGADDIEKSRRFYDALFEILGVGPGYTDSRGRVFYRMPTGAFGITRPIDGKAACSANGGTIGFAASTPDQVKAWHDAGLRAGGTSCEDPPGVRSGFGAYAAYLRDPAGNKLCASCAV